MVKLTAFVALACAQAPLRPPAAVSSQCLPVRGKMPAYVPGAAEARGVLMVGQEVVGRPVYVALDHSTQAGSRRIVPVGTLTPKGAETRFRCITSAPQDSAFWKFVFVAEPGSQDECAYLAEVSDAREVEVELSCRPEAREIWQPYRNAVAGEAQ